MWKRRLNTRVYINKIDRSGPRVLQNTKIISDRKQGKEGSQRCSSWVISTGIVCPQTEPRLQRQSWHTVPCFRGEAPRPNIRRSEAAELPDAFIIKVPSGYRLRDRAPQPGAEGVPQLVCR